jgi:hypothetical protein
VQYKQEVPQGEGTNTAEALEPGREAEAAGGAGAAGAAASAPAGHQYSTTQPSTTVRIKRLGAHANRCGCVCGCMRLGLCVWSFACGVFRLQEERAVFAVPGCACLPKMTMEGVTAQPSTKRALCQHYNPAVHSLALALPSCPFWPLWLTQLLPCAVATARLLQAAADGAGHPL